MRRNFLGYQGGNSVSSISKLKKPSEYLYFSKISFFSAPICHILSFRVERRRYIILESMVEDRKSLNIHLFHLSKQPLSILAAEAVRGYIPKLAGSFWWGKSLGHLWDRQIICQSGGSRSFTWDTVCCEGSFVNCGGGKQYVRSPVSVLVWGWGRGWRQEGI